MKKFAFMMIASMAMTMAVSLTSCHKDSNVSEGGDAMSDDTLEVQVEENAAAQAKDGVSAAEVPAEETPAEDDSADDAE